MTSHSQPKTNQYKPQIEIALLPDSTGTLEQIAQRRGVSVTFLRKEIARGRLRAIVLAPNSHRKKLRVFYRDELAWLEACTANTAS